MNHKVVNVFGWIMVIVGVLGIIGSLTSDTVNTPGIISSLTFISLAAIVISYSRKAIKAARQSEVEIAVQAELAKRAI